MTNPFPTFTRIARWLWSILWMDHVDWLVDHLHIEFDVDYDVYALGTSRMREYLISIDTTYVCWISLLILSDLIAP